MAALTITSASIDSTGQIATVIIGGSTGALSFSASPGRLVFIVYTQSGTQYSIPTGNLSSGNISGTTVTVPILGIIPASALITGLQVQGCGVGNGGNLTDTLSNTSPSNTVTPTNNSAVPTPATPALVYDNVGYFAYTWDDTVSGPALMGFGSQDFSTASTLDFVVSGTDFVLNYKSTTGTTASISASVDNGGYNNVGFTNFGNLTGALIFTGLSAGPHTVSIKFITSVVKIDKSILGFVYGGTGAISQPLSGTANAPSFWATTYPATAFHQYQVVGAGNAFNTYFTPECGTTTTANLSAGWNLATSAINPVAYVGMSFSFTISGPPTTCKIFCSEAAEAFVIRVDGVEVGHVVASSVANTSTFLDLTSILSGISAGSHSVVVTLIGWQTAMFIGSFLVVGATITTSPPAARTHWWFHGDSITLGLFTPAIATNGNIGYRNTFVYMLASVLNVAYTNGGKSGAPCHYFNGSGETPNVDSSEHTAVNIVNCNHTVAQVVGLWGDNDIRQVGTNSAGRPHAVTTQSITASGTAQTVTISGSTFSIGDVIQVDVGAADPSNPGANYEAVTLTGAAAGSVTGIFTKNHLTNITVSKPELIGEFQTSFFNTIQTVLSGLSGVKWDEFAILPMGENGSGAAYGLLTSGSAAVVGSANIAAWNAKKLATMQTSGSGNGKGDNTTYLTSAQAARVAYHDTYQWGLNGYTVSNYDWTMANYTTNYITGSPTGIHPNDAGNQLLNATNLGNGIVALNMLAVFSPPMGVSAFSRLITSAKSSPLPLFE